MWVPGDVLEGPDLRLYSHMCTGVLRVAGDQGLQMASVGGRSVFFVCSRKIELCSKKSAHSLKGRNV